MANKNYKTKNTDKPKDDEERLQDILKRFSTSLDYYADDYQRNEEDNSFAFGEQWPERIRAERERTGRPCLTENRLIPFINKVCNDIRKANPTIIPKPVDSKADVETAEIMRGIIKNIETISGASTVYDTAAANAIKAGYGWIRIKTQYVDHKSFDQEVRLSRVLNPRSVLLDPTTTEMDGSDAGWAFIYEDLELEEFERQYPKSEIQSIELAEGNEHWKTEKTIRIAEYFYKDHKDDVLVKFISPVDNSTVIDLEENVPDDAVEIDRRDISIPKIKYCKISGAEILEESEFVGEYIPIVPVFGLEAWLDGKRQIFSLIHQAIDPQRMFNYWKTASTEIIALQPKAPFVGAVGQFKSDPKSWQNANRENLPFLQYDPLTKEGLLVPPPMRQAPPTNSGTMMQEAMSAADGIKATLGIYDAGLGQQTADISGKAIVSRQLQGETSTYHFVDNLAIAMNHVGRILVDIIPKVYSGKRIVRITGEDDVERKIPLGQPIMKDGKHDFRPMEQGESRDAFYDLNVGKYDVHIEVGASYATRRQETSNALLEFGRISPEIAANTADILAKNLDIPGGDELVKRIQATMNPELLGDDVEAKRLQQLTGAVSELKEQLQKAQDALLVKQNDQAHKNKIDYGKLENEVNKTSIEAMKAMAEVKRIEKESNIAIPAEAMKNVSEAIGNLNAKVEDITGAMEEILTSEELASGVPLETPVIEQQ